MNYTKNSLPTDLDWAEYRKKGVTRMAPIIGPATVATKEGDCELPEGWSGFIALDADYVAARTYERVS